MGLKYFTLCAVPVKGALTLPFCMINKLSLTQLHTVSRTLQGRQREPSVKTLRSPLSAEFWRHCVLSGGSQRRPLSRHQSEEIKI